MNMSTSHSYPHQSQQMIYFDDSQSQRSHSQPFWLSQSESESQSQSHSQSNAIVVPHPPSQSRFDPSPPATTTTAFRAPLSAVSGPTNSLNNQHQPNFYPQYNMHSSNAIASSSSHQGTLGPPSISSCSNSNNYSNSQAITASVSREATPAVTSGANGGDNVPSRVLKSLQTLVLLIEKQNAKLDRNDERIQALAEQVHECKASSELSCKEIDRLMAQVVAKVDKFSSTTSRTMLQDLTNNLSKELNQIRKETAEVNKASKALSIVAAKGGMDAVIANQERILRTLTADKEAGNTSSNEDMISRITDHQLDIVHRLTDQMRMVSASITTSGQYTNRLVQQSADRHERTQLGEFNRLAWQLDQTVAKLTSAFSAFRQPTEFQQKETCNNVTSYDILPTPPTSQMAPTTPNDTSKTNMARPESAANIGVENQIRDAVDFAAGEMQVEAPARTATASSALHSGTTLTRSGDIASTTSITPLPRSPLAKRSLQSNLTRSIPFKRRKIHQSDDEVDVSEGEASQL